MSVDKFGRYARKSRAVRGPKGEGFNLTPDGDYDIKRKRLRNVEDPQDGLDAVNLRTHANGFLNCLTLQNGSFDAQKKRVINLENPVNHDDAVTKGFLGEKIPIRLDDKQLYSFHQYKVQDVAAPENAGDAVNLAHFKDNALVKDINGGFDAKNTTIQNLAPPSKDADAVNKVYLDRVLPLQTERSWNFKNKRLTQVGLPFHEHDAVTISYLKDNVLSTDANKEWDARGKRIKNVIKPEGLHDAVNKIFLKQALTDLAYTVYKQLNKNKRNAQDLANWKLKAMQDTSTWEDLFN